MNWLVFLMRSCMEKERSLLKNKNNIKLLSQKHMKMPKVEQRRKECEELLLKGLSKNKIYIWLGIVVIALLMASDIGKDQRLEELTSFVSHSPSHNETKAVNTYISQ